LTGTWRDEHVFVLKQAVALYDFYTQQILECDQEIERLYSETRPDWDGGELQPLSSRKRNSHSKNQFYESEKIRGHLKRISGVDISLVDGFGVSLAQTVIMECGTDMSKFPTDKHFCSWLGLAPKHKISGGKVLNNKTLKTKNRAGQAFRHTVLRGLVVYMNCRLRNTSIEFMVKPIKTLAFQKAYLL
jgi:transposase